MIASLLKRISKLLRIIHARMRLLALQAQHGTHSFPADLELGTGVRISVTDNGQVRLSRHSCIDNNATIVVKHGKLSIGSGAYIGIGAVICARASINIGNDVLIAEHVTIRDQDHNFGPGKITARSGFSTSEIVIGDNVWLGAKVTVTKGVRIGENTVIGANSVVTRDIPANVVAAGAPARVVRTVGPDEQIRNTAL